MNLGDFVVSVANNLQMRGRVAEDVHPFQRAQQKGGFVGLKAGKAHMVVVRDAR